jgi:DnaA family protein
MKQIPLAITVDPVPVFDSYVPGRNEAALEHLRRLRAPAAPVYLWGDAGSGKTHLLSALAHEAQAAGGRVGWFDAGQPLPWTVGPGHVLTIVDDVQALDAAEQGAAFTLFGEAASLGVPFVAAGRLPPVDLPLRDDLRTRLGWGHVFELSALDEAETRAALRRHADQRGVLLSDEVMGYLLARCSRDLKSLVALVAELDTYGLATSRAITVPMLKQLLAERAPSLQT